MDRLPTRVNRADPDFAERKAHNLALIDELRVRLDTASQGGGGKYVERHRSRGKHLARERIEARLRAAIAKPAQCCRQRA